MIKFVNYNTMEINSKIFIAGHNGMVGSSILRNLKSSGYKNILLRSRKELDLTDQNQVISFFKKEKPEYVFLSAAKVGGIMANKNFKADFIYQNLMIQSNIIHSSYLFGVKKLLFLGSSCIYPKNSSQPIKEEYLLSGFLEETNDSYAIAKISGIKMCQSYNQQYGTNFISVMPTNLYGIGDNYDTNNSHVLPALIRKIHDAKINNKKSVEIWGTGKPMREFLFSDDLSDALILLMINYNSSDPINVGVGEDIKISELVNIICDVIGYKGEILYDKSKPDGTMRKLLDISKIKKMGWVNKTSLKDGIIIAYNDFLKRYE